MSILDSKSKKMLVESMRGCVKSILKESTVLTSKQATDKSKFVSEKATYEQLLNITMNPLRESKYLPDYVLEGAVAILHRACLTGRKHIGVNAITEGALKLHKETGAVITESMLDAALRSVEHGCGLKVIGGILKEAAIVMEGGESLAIDLINNRLPTASQLNPTELNSLKSAIQNRLHGGNPLRLDRNQPLLSRLFGGDTAKAGNFITAINTGNTSVSNQLLRGSLKGVAVDRMRNATTPYGYETAKRQISKLSAPLKKGPATRIPNPGGLVNPDITAMMNKAKGGGWGKAALIGAAALGAGAVGMHYFNKRNQAQQQEQQ